MLCRRFEIPHRLGIGQTEHHREYRFHVVRVRGTRPMIEIRRQGVVADIGKAPGDVADVLDQPEGFMDDDDAGISAGLARLGEVALDRVVAAVEFYLLATHTAGIGHRTRYVRHSILLETRLAE